jgi:hypothetical protein
MHVPLNAQQNGDVITWPAVRGSAPTISASFEATDLKIAEYASENPNRFGAALYEPSAPDENGIQVMTLNHLRSESELRSRIVYDKIWEIESLKPLLRRTVPPYPPEQFRIYRRVFETGTGVVVVTASAEQRSWAHPFVTQMLKAMKSSMVFEHAHHRLPSVPASH